MPEGGIGRTELLIGLAVVAVLALITLPMMLGPGHDAKRAQAEANVNSIREAELTNMKHFDGYVSADFAPRAPEAVNGEPVKWEASKGFAELAWKPDNADAVYCSYVVSARADGFEVKGTCDLDGDGRRATFVATHEKPAELVSKPDVF